MDLHCFKERYLTLSEKLYRVAFYILESRSDAEDALQELYLKLWQGNAFLDKVQNPLAYSIRLLKNICIDRIRLSRKVTLTDDFTEPYDSNYEDEQIDSRLRLDKVLSAIKSLPERQRQIVTLRLLEGKTFDEIASITGLNYLTIRVMLSRARKVLKRYKTDS